MQLWKLLLVPALVSVILSLVMVIRRRRGRWAVSAIAMTIGLVTCVSWVLRPPTEPDSTDEPIEVTSSEESLFLRVHAASVTTNTTQAGIGAFIAR